MTCPFFPSSSSSWVGLSTPPSFSFSVSSLLSSFLLFLCFFSLLLPFLPLFPYCNFFMLFSLLNRCLCFKVYFSPSLLLFSFQMVKQDVNIFYLYQDSSVFVSLSFSPLASFPFTREEGKKHVSFHRFVMDKSMAAMEKKERIVL